MSEKKGIVECRVPDGETVPDCRQNLGWWCGECPFSTFISLRDGMKIYVYDEAKPQDSIKVDHIWV